MYRRSRSGRGEAVYAGGILAGGAMAGGKRIPAFATFDDAANARHNVPARPAKGFTAMGELRQPSAWGQFVHGHRGQGLSFSQLSDMYRHQQGKPPLTEQDRYLARARRLEGQQRAQIKQASLEQYYGANPAPPPEMFMDYHVERFQQNARRPRR